MNLLTAQQPGLRIAIVEGDGAINNINQKITVVPVVEVRDESGQPVEGAAVVFFLPTQGPGGTFANGTNTLNATTDRQGRAIANGIRLNRQTGKFDIRVTASQGGQTASATITQTNVSGVSSREAADRRKKSGFSWPSQAPPPGSEYWWRCITDRARHPARPRSSSRRELPPWEVRTKCAS